jgi:hypothetical protein
LAVSQKRWGGEKCWIKARKPAPVSKAPSPSLPMHLRGDARVALQGSGKWQPHPACCRASLRSEGFWLEACPDCTLTRLWNFLVFLLHLRIWKDSRWARQVALRIAQSLDQCWSRIWSASPLLPGLLGWQRPSLLESEAKLLGQGSFEEHLWYCSFVRDQSLGLGLELDAFLRLLLAFWSDLSRDWPRSKSRLGQVSQEHDAIQKRFQERGVEAGFWRCALAVIPERRMICQKREKNRSRVETLNFSSNKNGPGSRVDQDHAVPSGSSPCSK